MGKSYTREDAMERIISKRTAKKWQTSAEILIEYINKIERKYSVKVKDLRKDIPGQLEIKE